MRIRGMLLTVEIWFPTHICLRGICDTGRVFLRLRLFSFQGTFHRCLMFADIRWGSAAGLSAAQLHRGLLCSQRISNSDSSNVHWTTLTKRLRLSESQSGSDVSVRLLNKDTSISAFFKKDS